MQLDMMRWDTLWPIYLEGSGARRVFQPLENNFTFTSDVQDSGGWYRVLVCPPR